MIRVDLLTDAKKGLYEEFLDNAEISSAMYSLEWSRAICDLGKDSSYFIVAEEDGKIVGVLPLYYYKGRFGNLLNTNAWHTISGITCLSNCDRKRVYEELLDYCLYLAKELDCSVVSIGTNPFLEDKEYYFEVFKPDYVMENFVQYICLKEIFDENGVIVHPNYAKRTNLSRNLEKAKLQKVVISDVQSEDNVNQLFKIQEKRMKELGTSPFPPSFMHSVLKNLTLHGKGKYLFAFIDEKMVAGCLFLANKKVMDIYMMCMDSDYKEVRMNYALTDYMLKWGYKNGISFFHWMSSPCKGDGVYKWKEQWGSRERTFWYLTRILGDISQWRRNSLSELAKAYEWHYLLPFNLLANSNKNFTTKNELTSFLKSFQ